MARAKLAVDLEFSKIDQKDIDKVINDMQGKLKNMKLDPGWADKFADAQKQLSSLRSESAKLIKESNKFLEDQERITEKISESEQKIIDLKKKRDDILEKSNEKGLLSLNLQRKYNDLQKKIYDDQNKLKELTESGLDDDKSKLNMKKLEGNIDGNKFKRDQLLAKLGSDERDSLEKAAAIDSEINKIHTKRIDLIGESKNITDDIAKRTNEINDLQAEEKGIEKQLYDMEVKRSAQQQIIAASLEKSGKYTKQEAFDKSKKILPISMKQSKLELKGQELYKKSKKFRKEQIKDELARLKIMKEGGALAGLGFLDKAKILREERKGIFKKYGHKPVEEKAKDAAGGVGKKVVAGAEGQLGGLIGVVGKLAGPLMALGSIAGFVMLMLDYNDKVNEARKSLYKLSATGSTSFKNLAKGQVTNVKNVEAFRSSLRGLYNEVGMTYEDALKATETLTKAGVELDVTQAKTRQDYKKFIGEVETAATIAGLSFEEMASYAGDLTTELQKSKEEIPKVFKMLRADAATAGVVTNRFYTSVINAAQGMAIYGTKIEDVSGAFAVLTKKMGLPQKQAMQIAQNMLESNKTLDASHKAMISQQVGAKGLLTTERDQLQTLKNSGKASEDQQKRLIDLNSLLATKFPNQLEEGVRYFEAFDPAKQLELRFKGVAIALKDQFKGVDLANPAQLKDVLAKNREALINVGKQYGFNEEDIRGFENLVKAGVSIENMPKQFKEMSQKLRSKETSERAKEQAHAIELGTRPLKEILMQGIAGVIEKIYLWLEKEAIPFFKMVGDFMGKNYKEAKYVSEALDDKLSNLLKQKEDTEKEIKILETSDIPEDKKRAEQKRAELAGLDVNIKKTQQEQEVMKSAKKRAAIPVVGGLLPKPYAAKQIEEKTERNLWTEKTDALENKISSLPSFTVRNAAISILQGLREKGSIGLAMGKGQKGVVSKAVDAEVNSQIGSLDTAGQAQIRNFFSDLKKFRSGGYTGNKELPFATGGYTGNVGIGSAAGLVHGKEFVFDAQSTKNIGVNNLNKMMKSGAAGSGSMGSFDISKLTQFLNATQMAKTGAKSGGGTINNSVVINVNQRDKQEIEQIIYKVLYDQKGREI